MGYVGDSETMAVLYNIADENGAFVPQVKLLDTDICSGIDLFFDPRFVWWRDHVVAWRKIYRHEFLVSNNIRFADFVMYEDNDYALSLFAKAVKVRHLSLLVYAYRNNPSSFIRSEVTVEKLMFKLSAALRVAGLHKYLANADVRFDKLVHGFVNNILSDFCSALKTFGNAKTIKSWISKADWKVLKRYMPIKKYINLRYLI